MQARKRSATARVSRGLLGLGLGLATLLLPGCERELGVYTLCSYEGNWKANVCVDAIYDPYYTFWDLMTAGTDAPYADSDDSHRLRNSEVHIQTVLPIGGDSFKGWDQYDLVFFYGHHNTVVPPHPHDSFGYYTYSGGSWTHHTGYLDTIDWGHATPYDYWAIRPVTDANNHPGSVNYLYHSYTSALLGGTRDYSGGNLPWRREWNDPIQYEDYGRLGSGDLEWLILHGCQAVITANEDGSTYLPLALDTFAPTQGGWHIVMGHYVSYYTSQLEPLDGFAADLLAGVPIQTAYFDTDPALNTSAIAAEDSPFTWAASTMANDRWDDALADVDDATLFSQRWIVPWGVAQHSGSE
jgi:hypothetical protein